MSNRCNLQNTLGDSPRKHLVRQQLPTTTAPDCAWPSLRASCIDFRDNEEAWPLSFVRKVASLRPRDQEVKRGVG